MVSTAGVWEQDQAQGRQSSQSPNAEGVRMWNLQPHSLSTPPPPSQKLSLEWTDEENLPINFKCLSPSRLSVTMI